jgi:centromeric protein E
MATSTLPRPSMAPNSPLPSIPVPKQRTSSVHSIASAPATPAHSGSGLPLPGRTPSGVSPRPSGVPNHVTAASLSRMPSPSDASQGSTRPLRKTISIGSFPQPPRVGPRSSSQASSPASQTPPITPLTPKTPNPAKRAVSQGTGLRRPPRTSSRQSTNGSRAFSSATSLLNGADGKSVSLLSLPSSRASSVQGSYSPNFDDDSLSIARGRHRSLDDVKSEADKYGKDRGNVVVSVRVRPDVASDKNKSELEWMVDGRKSLISYRGKEGGEYLYGEFIQFSLSSVANFCQIMFLLLMIITPKYTILLQND